LSWSIAELPNWWQVKVESSPIIDFSLSWMAILRMSERATKATNISTPRGPLIAPAHV
jgi:hypothetical protein